MAVNYRDNTPFEGDNHTVGELAEAIRTKMYGVDVREPIAQAVEKMENWTKGNNIGNIIATPTKVFANLSALQSAYPNGADGIMVTADNGHKYFWQSNSWTDGGEYQTSADENLSFLDLSTSTTDANSLTTSKKYWIYASDLDKAKSLHFPVKEDLSTLTVKAYNSNFLMQTSESENYQFVRFKTNGNWNGWKKRNISNSVLLYLTSGNSQNINNANTLIEDNSVFWLNITSKSDAVTLNYPPVVDFGALYVNSYTENFVIQIFETLNGSWARTKNNGVWGAWKNKALGDVTDFLYILENNENDVEDANELIATSKKWLTIESVAVAESLNYPAIKGKGILTIDALSSNYVLQTYKTGTDNFVRSKTDGFWNGWVNLNAAGLSNASVSGLAQFKKFGVIGDSLSVGHFSNNSNRNLWYSWPQSLARSLGNRAVNFGTSGDTVLTWWSTHASNGKNLLGSSGNKCQAYVVALGVNDQAYVSLGTIDDVKDDYSQNSDTFYGGYARILSYIHEVNPQAPIFCLTDVWLNSTRSAQYDEAVRSIVADNRFKNFCILVDMARDARSDFSVVKKEGYMMNDHNNAAGYSIGGKIVDRYIGVAWEKSNFTTVNVAEIDFDE